MVSDTGQELNKTSEMRQAVVQFDKQSYTADLINEKLLNASIFLIFFEGLLIFDEESNEGLMLPLTVKELYSIL